MNSLQDSTNNSERRSGTDRRKKPPRLFCKYLLTGRRAVPRRREDVQRPQEIDRYSSKVFAIIIFIIGLSILDASLTLFLVDNGAKELNPFMAYYLERSPFLFVCVKYLLTCAAVILILFCKDFYIFKTRTKARILFLLILVPFVFVIQWQLYLILSGF